MESRMTEYTFDKAVYFRYNNHTFYVYGGVKVSTGILQYGKRVAVQDRYKT